MLEEYRQHAEERALLGIPPLPLNASQTSNLCDLLTHSSEALQGELLLLLI
jgi:aconitate hydratase 2/2-methylisocitrate dehydratase